MQMKTLISVLFITICFNCVAQDSIEKVSMSSSTNMELVLKRLEIKIDSLSTNIEQLKQERNYFQAALSSETTIFTMIFGAVFSVIGFFSFLIVKIQLHGSEKKVELMINAQKEKFTFENGKAGRDLSVEMT